MHVSARLVPACLLAFLLAATAGSAATSAEGWTRVDYGPLVDGRRPTHSGEPVSVLLSRLGGRPLPADGSRPADRLAHVLLDPMLEPYAFVLSDVLDSAGPPPRRPWVELGGLWDPGQPQPAWAELLRARRFVVESDGAGRIRAILPLPPGGLDPAAAGPDAGKAALDAAWPVLRHVLAAERARLEGAAAADTATAGNVELRLEAYAYVHHPEITTFDLAVEPHVRTVRDTSRRSGRPPLDLAAWQRFLDRGLRLEGARLDEDGSVVLLGSEADTPPTILGEPVSLADLAVAYRAVFHGGLAEPYMSLDRGYVPWVSVVNYGGRLRDTRPGWVSLLCDIRFKTFSQGLDLVTRRDLRAALRKALPSFRTHVEHFAEDPASAGVMSQQTRLWFYPDDVDLTISEQADVLVLRRVRMTAASERLQEGGIGAAAGEDPPWTRATVRAINRDYDALAGLFPEMHDLDQVVRLLSLFTWLRAAERAGHLLPDLDALLAVRLPAAPTPRSLPQMLAFNALPQPGSDGTVGTFDRIDVAVGLDRALPDGGRPLDPATRFRRVLGALDPASPNQRSIAEELSALDPSALSDTELDFQSYRGERVLMHDLVLGTLRGSPRDRIAGRVGAGERLRIFSIGIGGLDLDMSRAVARAGGRSLGLGGTDAGGARRASASAVPPARATEREPDRRPDSPDLPVASVPDHGAAATGPGRVVHGAHVVETVGESYRVITGRDGPEVRSRETEKVQPAGIEVRRVEDGRFLSYSVRADGPTSRIRLVDRNAAAQATGVVAGPGTAVLRILASADPAAASPVPVRLIAPDGRALGGDYPRSELLRVVRGRALDVQDDVTVPGLLPLPGELAVVDRLLVEADRLRMLPPWEGARERRPGEEIPTAVAAGLDEWRRVAGLSRPAVAVAVRRDAAAAWSSAPRPGKGAVLLLPEDAMPGPAGALRDAIRESWTAGPVAQELPRGPAPVLVVVVSAESPGRFAARLRALAESPEMNGKLLAAWSLGGPTRSDLPSTLLESGGLAAVAIAGVSMVDWESVPRDVARLSRALEGTEAVAVEDLPGPLLWHF